MRSIFLCLITLAGFVLLVSCGSTALPTDPSANLPSGTGSVQLTIKFSTVASAPGVRKAPASDFTTGIVVLTKGALTRSAPIVISGGRATASIANLAAGTWNVTINFYNAAGDLTFTGTTSVVVRNGVATPVSVVVNPVDGSIVLDIPLPIDATATLILHNTLGSDLEISTSLVGSSLSIMGSVAYAPAYFDNGVHVELWAGLQFPADLLNRDAGTVEFWYAADNRENGGVFFLFDVRHSDYSTSDGFFSYLEDQKIMLRFNSATGATASFPITYATGVPVHLAYVWNFAGIDGSADAWRLYVDGIQVAQGAGSGSLLDSTGGTFVLGNSWDADPNVVLSGARSARGTFDNLKVWSGAKTDFSDRFTQ